MPPDPETYLCPFCGSEASVGRPCAGCAPKHARRAKRQPPRPPERRPWAQDEDLDGLDLPDEDFDYEAFVAREFGSAPHRRLGVKWYWWVLGVVLVVALLAFAVRW